MSITGVAQPGACFVGNELMHCSLWEKDCNGMAYKSHRKLQGTEHAKTCAGEYTHTIGMCASEVEKFLCTGHDSNCALPFVDHVPHCNLQYNHFPHREIPFSLYGKCVSKVTKDFGPSNFMDDIVRQGTCVWSEESCINHHQQDNTFVPASEQMLNVGEGNYDQLCTCDKVKIGACVHSIAGYFSCAVSADSCDVDTHFHSWQRLAEVGKDCRLCDAFDKSSAVKTFSKPQVEEPQCNLAGASMGGIVAGVLVTLLTSFGLAFARRRGCFPRGDHSKAGDGVFVDPSGEEEPASRESTAAPEQFIPRRTISATPKKDDNQNEAVVGRSARKSPKLIQVVAKNEKRLTSTNVSKDQSEHIDADDLTDCFV